MANRRNAPATGDFHAQDRHRGRARLRKNERNQTGTHLLVVLKLGQAIQHDLP